MIEPVVEEPTQMQGTTLDNSNIKRNKEPHTETAAVEQRSTVAAEASIDEVGGNSDVAETETNDQTTVDVRWSNRRNKGVINRTVMDTKGKDYRSYTAKQYAQIIKNKRDA